MSKINICFKAVGNAHILKTNRYQISSSFTIKHTRYFLQHQLLLFHSLELHIRTLQNNIYYPQDTESLSNLSERFAQQNELVLWYMYHPDGQEKTSQYCPQCNYQTCLCGYMESRKTYNELDNILLNMKIISNLEDGDKILYHDGYFNIDKADWYQGIRRWWQGSNRVSSIDQFIRFTRQVLSLLKYILSHRDSFRYDTRIELLKKNFKCFIPTTLTLLNTYQEDKEMVMKITTLGDELNQVQSKLKEASNDNHTQSTNPKKQDIELVL